MEIRLPRQVNIILQTLESRGYEAYAVGGCVRDSLMGRTPHDWDITTSATPQQIKACFSHTIDTGIAHGTVTVLMRKEDSEISGPDDSIWNGYEVTTYRIDGAYLDGRHPQNVQFTSLLSEDLRRRDFTINAMAYNTSRGLVDLFDGQADLQNRVIRCVGVAEERFSEDALRMMRAVRFAAQLDAALAPATEGAIAKLAPTLNRISAERIRDELLKLVTSDHPERIRDLQRLGLTAQFLPEWDVLCATPQNTPHHRFDVAEHTIAVLEDLARQDHPAQNGRDLRVLRLAGLLHDIGKPLCRTTDANGRDHFKGHPLTGAEMTRGILRRLRLDNDTVDAVTCLVRYHDERPATERAVRRLASKVPADLFPLLLQLRMADTMGQSDYHREEKIEAVRETAAYYQAIVERQDALSIKDLAINGKDLLELGIPAGKEIGACLEYLLQCVLEEPEQNKKELLKELAVSFMESK